MLRYLSVVLLSLGILLTSSCRSLKEPDFQGIGNIRVSRIGLKQSFLTLDMIYLNPNHTGVKLRSAEGDAWLNNNFLGHFTIDTLIRIAPNSAFTLPVKLQVDMSHILQNSLAALLDPELLVRIEGKASVGKGFVYIRYPIRYEGKQTIKF